MSIERWDLERIDYEDFEMQKDSSGRYVEWEDHLDIVKQLQDRIEDLESDLTYARNN